MADKVIKPLRPTYADLGLHFATEELRTQHGMELVKETVR
jgi:hypothetical protein